jgi:hypothetical protein
MLEAGAFKGRDLRLEVCRIRSGASRDRPRDVVWLDFMASHRHRVVDMTVTSTCTNTSAPLKGARLPLPGNLALGAHKGKLDADLRTSPFIYLPFNLSMYTIPSLWRMGIGAGWRLLRPSWSIAWPFWWPFVASVAWVRRTRSFRSDSYFRTQHFVRRTTVYVPFRRFLGDMRREFEQRLSTALHGTLGSYLRHTLKEGSAERCCGMPSYSSGL